MTNHDEAQYFLAVDKICAMMQKENTAYSYYGSFLNQGIEEDWRRKICEWAYDVVDHFNYDRET
eukprot:11896514-Ditylum_brightwellii.AAC.1